MIPLSIEAEKKLLVLRQEYGQLFYINKRMSGHDHEIVFRPMTLNETRAVSLTGPAMSVLDLNELICDWCVLFSEPNIRHHDQIPAALPDVIAQCIIETSGFDSKENFTTLLAQSRTSATSVEAGIEIFICKAFPGISPWDVQNMNLYQQMEMLGKAEVALGTELPITDGEQKGSMKGRRPPKTAAAAEAQAILAREAADIPDVARDNALFSNT